jgi:hypothetical protein
VSGFLTISMALQAAATVTTFVTMWRMGDKAIDGPVWGQVSQAAWLALVIHEGLWGILPITLTMIVIHARNYRKWRTPR